LSFSKNFTIVALWKPGLVLKYQLQILLDYFQSSIQSWLSWKFRARVISQFEKFAKPGLVKLMIFFKSMARLSLSILSWDYDDTQSFNIGYLIQLHCHCLIITGNTDWQYKLYCSGYKIDVNIRDWNFEFEHYLD